MLRIEPASTVCKADALSSVLSLWPPHVCPTYKASHTDSRTVSHIYSCVSHTHSYTAPLLAPGTVSQCPHSHAVTKVSQIATVSTYIQSTHNYTFTHYITHSHTVIILSLTVTLSHYHTQPQSLLAQSRTSDVQIDTHGHTVIHGHAALLVDILSHTITPLSHLVSHPPSSQIDSFTYNYTFITVLHKATLSHTLSHSQPRCGHAQPH